MAKEKPLSTPLASHFKLKTNQCPYSIEAKVEMSNIPCASVAGSLMYAMVWICPDIAYSICRSGK